jgi:SPP1 gp7 family putative phage head morphogenesis protein
MPLILDPKQLKKLESKKRLKKFRKPKSPIEAERLLKRRLAFMWKRILFPATERIKELVKQGVSPDILANELRSILNQVEFEYNLGADDVMPRWSGAIDDKTKIAMNHALGKSLGIDVSVLYDQKKISDVLTMGGMEASQLIRTIPGEYLGQVARAVNNNFKGTPLPDGRTLIQQITHLSGVSENRAKIIARDQTSKLQGILTQVRQESIGIDTYIWRNSKDQRVVGNPSGKYPKGNAIHMNHWVREGKKYKWSDPPADGHPGQAILCRCWAEAVLDLKSILKNTEKL